jgi:regulator of vacuolar morphogenesis
MTRRYEAVQRISVKTQVTREGHGCVIFRLFKSTAPERSQQHSQSSRQHQIQPKMPYAVSIPSTALSSGSKPHTVYNLTVSWPMKTDVLPKRYNDFAALHAALAPSPSSPPPPAPLPAKGWFTRTVNNDDLTEQRRAGLEAYLRAIEDDADARWRSAPEYRAFLGIAPSSAASIRSADGDGKKASSTPPPPAQPTQAAPGAGLAPAEWLELHGALRAHLQEARAAIARRDAAARAPEQREAAAAGARALVRARGAAARLDEALGLAEEDARGGGRGRRQGRLGAGEMRRRRDLLGRAAAEREALEALLAAWAPRPAAEQAAGRGAGREELFAGGGGSPGAENGLLGTSPASPPGRSRGLAGVWGGARGGRVLGGPAKETKRTMERDNEGVLRLQRQIMQEQDADVDVLAEGVRRIKEMSIAINEELVEQGQLLDVLDQDVDRYVPLAGVCGLADALAGLGARLAWRGRGSRRSIRRSGECRCRRVRQMHRDTQCLNRRATCIQPVHDSALVCFQDRLVCKKN